MKVDPSGFKFLLFLFLFAVLLCDCRKPNDSTDPGKVVRSEGVFVVNEGSFNHSNASLGWYDFETESYYKELYKSANNVDLGDVFQSICFSDEQLILTINNSDKIEVVDATSLVRESVFSAINSPRYVLEIDEEKAYVSSLKEPWIGIWSRASNSLIKRIDFPGWSESMIKYNDYVIVSNPSFYSGTPTEFIYIIDTNVDKVVDSIKVLTSPGEIVLDRNNHLWVYCQGHFQSKKNGGIVKVDLDSRKMIKSFPFEDLNQGYSSALAKNLAGDSILYIRNDVFKVSIDMLDLPKDPVIKAAGRTLYALGSDKYNRIWVGDAIDYIQSGVVSVYSARGVLNKEFRVGVIPSKFYFQ